MTKVVSAPQFFRQMSTEEFLKLGIRDIAYVKPVDFEDSHKGYTVHAADGTVLSVKNSMDLALTAIVQSDLAPITIH